MGDLLLLVDYPARRPEAHLTELDLEQAGYRCISMVRDPLLGVVSTEDYARRLCDATPEIAGATGVVSYCACAPLASAIARLTAERAGRPIPVAYLDPSTCDVHHIVDGYASVLRQVNRGTPADLLPEPLDVARLLAEPALLLDALDADLRKRALISLTAEGFGTAETLGPLEQITGMYLRWLTYLVAMHHRGKPEPSGEVLQLVSQLHPEQAQWLGIDGAPVRRVPCGRPELARHPQARQYILGFLAHSRPEELPDGD